MSSNILYIYILTYIMSSSLDFAITLSLLHFTRLNWLKMLWIPSIMFTVSHTIKYTFIILINVITYYERKKFKDLLHLFFCTNPLTPFHWYSPRPLLPKLANSRNLLNGYSIALYPPSTHPYILKSKYKIHDSNIKSWVFQRGL